MSNRAEILLAPIPRSGRIIELDAALGRLASKSDGWNVASLSCSVLQGETRQPGQSAAAAPREQADYVWDDGPLSAAVPSAMHGTFDALIAGHVIERTPDLIDFLKSAALLVKPPGLMALVVPDKRYCGDYFQPLTLAGEVIEAHAERLSQHNPGRLFDYYAYAVTDSDLGAWDPKPIEALRLARTIEQARDEARAWPRDQRVASPAGWRFSPAGFELLLLELARLGHNDWRVERITEAVNGEFFVWLRRGGLAAAAQAAMETFQAQRLTLLKRTLVETRAQIDWLLAGEPEIATAPLGLLPASLVTPVNAPPVAAPATPAEPTAQRYVDWFPARDNVGRAFDGEWSSAVPGLSTTGQIPLFDDGRIPLFEQRLNGGFAGKTVLELGPLEGGHTYMMAQRGARITAIESNLRAWMRCVAVKDTLGIPNTTFFLGDFVQYLAASPPSVDFVLASGVLYHMTDPAVVLRNLCQVSNAVGLWTHYFDPDLLRAQRGRGKFDFKPRRVATPHGRTVEYYGQSYLQALEWPGFCGGSAPGSNWMRRQDILGILQDEGFVCDTFLEHDDHQNGPAFCVFGQRQARGDRAS